jgi:hypothetical protein
MNERHKMDNDKENDIVVYFFDRFIIKECKKKEALGSFGKRVLESQSKQRVH